MIEPTQMEAQQEKLARLRLRARLGDGAVQDDGMERVSLPEGLDLRPADIAPDMYALLRETKMQGEIDALHRYLWCVAMQQGGGLSVTDAELTECPQGSVLTTARKGDVLRVWARPASMLRPVDISDDDDERSLKRVPTRPSTEADEAEDVW